MSVSQKLDNGGTLEPWGLRHRLRDVSEHALGHLQTRGHHILTRGSAVCYVHDL